MNRCRICVMPDTRPDHVFVDGVCPACINYQNRPEVDWDARLLQLKDLLDQHNGRCIVPSSGGKDSHYQVIKLLELGADPLIVTATTCHLTDIGRKNIDNLAKLATTIEVSPNKEVRAKLNRISLETIGDISWPEHASIFSTPFWAAASFDIPLVIYGENPQNQYGGPDQLSGEAMIMDKQWIDEFGGFLGLRPMDFVGKDGITQNDMSYYWNPLPWSRVEAHFLGQYIEWDSHRNAKVAAEHGMIQELPCFANWWKAENLDNAQTGIHDYLMYRKYGYGRGCTQISVDVRHGRITRGAALGWVREHDGHYPFTYAGYTLDEILGRIDVSKEKFHRIEKEFTNYDILEHVGSQDNTNHPVEERQP